MRSKDKQLEQLIQDFATDYADAKDKYKETLAKVHVSNDPDTVLNSTNSY